jgi:hypothetical protein
MKKNWVLPQRVRLVNPKYVPNSILTKIVCAFVTTNAQQPFLSRLNAYSILFKPAHSFNGVPRIFISGQREEFLTDLSSSKFLKKLSIFAFVVTFWHRNLTFKF